MSDHHKKTSQVWQFYSDAGEKRKSCRICNKTLSIKGGGLYNLSRHVRNKHPIEAKCLRLRSNNRNYANSSIEHDYFGNQFEEIAIEVESSTSDIHGSAESPYHVKSQMIKASHTPEEVIDIKPNIKDFKRIKLINNPQESPTDDIDKSFLRMLVKNYLPFSITEEPSFRAFLTQLNPKYQVPNKVLTNELLEKIYQTEVEEIKLSLKETKCVSLTIDSWNSVYEDFFISIAVHFLNNNTEMQSFLLECHRYKECETNEQLAANLSQIAEKWEILDKVLTVTSIDTENFQESVAFTGWRHVSCYASALNACIQKALLEIRDIQGKVQNIARIFLQNAQAVESLEQMQMHLGQQVQKVKQDIDTNWLSTYAMFQRMIDIRESVMMTLASDFPEVDNLDNNDITVLQKSCDILRIFKLATETMSTGKTMLISEVIPLSNLLLQRTKRFLVNNELPDALQKMINVLIVELSEQFTNLVDDELYITSTLLDPRFKVFGFPDKEPCILEKAKLTLYGLATSTVTAETEQVEKIDIDPDDIWAEFDTKVNESFRDKPTSSSIIEVDKYLDESLLSRQKSPIGWWEENKSSYPHLYEIVRQRLCIPATSMPPDIFSKADQIILDRRSRLPATKVDKLVFLNFNL